VQHGSLMVARWGQLGCHRLVVTCGAFVVLVVMGGQSGCSSAKATSGSVLSSLPFSEMSAAYLDLPACMDILGQMLRRLPPWQQLVLRCRACHNVCLVVVHTRVDNPSVDVLGVPPGLLVEKGVLAMLGCAFDVVDATADLTAR
jgi:hypothetical protein